MNKSPIGDFKVSWAICTALTALMGVAGIGWWEDLRLSGDPPGFAAGMGFFGTVLALALIVWFLIVYIIHRNKAIAKRFAAWMLAVLIGAIGLGFFAVPGFPAWGFYLTIAISGMTLYATNPFQKNP